MLCSPGFHGRSEVSGTIHLLCPGVSTGFSFPASIRGIRRTNFRKQRSVEGSFPCSPIEQLLLGWTEEDGVEVASGWCGTKRHISALPHAIMHQAVPSPLAKGQAGRGKCFCPRQRQRLLREPIIGTSHWAVSDTLWGRILRSWCRDVSYYHLVSLPLSSFPWVYLIFFSLALPPSLAHSPLG